MEIPGPHVSEIYWCNECTRTFHLVDVNKTWTCPTCRMPIQIKVVINDYEHRGLRLKPNQLQIDQLVTLDRVNTNVILAIEKDGVDYHIALKNYRRKTFSKDNFLLTIDGKWTY
jgi:DNA-directed RNA polymerase subunit RPC12/RpoP